MYPEKLATWQDVIDSLQVYREFGSDLLEPEDVPDGLTIVNAINFCDDRKPSAAYSISRISLIDVPKHAKETIHPPSSMTPSGNGQLTFLWETPTKNITVEFRGLRERFLTVFENGKVIACDASVV